MLNGAEVGVVKADPSEARWSLFPLPRRIFQHIELTLVHGSWQIWSLKFKDWASCSFFSSGRLFFHRRDRVWTDWTQFLNKISTKLPTFGHMITCEGPHFQAVCLKLRTLSSDHVIFKNLNLLNFARKVNFRRDPSLPWSLELWSAQKLSHLEIEAMIRFGYKWNLLMIVNGLKLTLCTAISVLSTYFAIISFVICQSHLKSN